MRPTSPGSSPDAGTRASAAVIFSGSGGGCFPTPRNGPQPAAIATSANPAIAARRPRSEQVRRIAHQPLQLADLDAPRGTLGGGREIVRDARLGQALLHD